MKLFSVLFFVLSLLILAISIYTSKYNCLIFVLLSGIISYATWPKQKPEKPYRNYKTWEDDDVR